MRSLMVALVLLTVCSGAFDKPTAAQETEVIAGGELEYQNYCAVCHGVDAKGQGIMSKFLTLRPADLTQIAKETAAYFRFGRLTAPSRDAKKFAATARAKCLYGVIASSRKRAAATVDHALRQRDGYSGWFFTYSIFKNRSLLRAL